MESFFRGIDVIALADPSFGQKQYHDTFVAKLERNRLVFCADSKSKFAEMKAEDSASGQDFNADMRSSGCARLQQSGSRPEDLL